MRRILRVVALAVAVCVIVGVVWGGEVLGQTIVGSIVAVFVIAWLFSGRGGNGDDGTATGTIEEKLFGVIPDD